MCHHLKGKRVLVTSGAAQAAGEIARLKGAGAHPIHIPLIEIVEPSDGFAALDRAIGEIEKFSWIVFTSKNGVSAFFKRLCGKKVPAQIKIAAVGNATAEKIEKLGLAVSLVPLRHDAEGLLEAMLEFVRKGERVLWPRAREGRDVLEKGLMAAGAEIVPVEAYQNILPPNVDRDRLISIALNHEVDAALFSSPSAVKNFVEIVGKKAARAFAMGAQIIPIGPVTRVQVEMLVEDAIDLDAYRARRSEKTIPLSKVLARRKRRR